MKLVQHAKQRLPNGDLRITAQFRDQMRRPMGVEVKTMVGDLAPVGEVILAEGAPEDMAKMFGEFANIAWEMGWRPRGLMGALPQFIQSFKLPPAAR